MKEYTFIVPCLFGLETFVAQEIRDLGYKVSSENGRVRFFGPLSSGARVNMFMRCGERVLLLMGEFEARTFTELFDQTKELPWEEWIVKDAQFPVKGHSLNSKLFSVSDCQSIIKKAVVERLKGVYGISWFSETAEKYQIQFAIMKDKVSLMLDLSGEGLFKRGYRLKSNEAPIRETLAAALVKISRYRRGDLFCDPMCGSGTIAIEAAMAGANIAPGIKRNFAAQSWRTFEKEAFNQARQEARDLVSSDPFTVYASDILPGCAALTRENAKRADVEKHINVKAMDLSKIKFDLPGGILICNPPYGERMFEQKQARELYKLMGRAFSALPVWKYYIITSDEAFESYFGKKADKKRKLYNGMIKCDLYQYFRRPRHENV